MANAKMKYNSKANSMVEKAMYKTMGYHVEISLREGIDQCSILKCFTASHSYSTKNYFFNSKILF